MAKENRKVEKRHVKTTVRVEIIGLKTGLQEFDANLVRIKDERFTILLMNNYNDSLGQIKGSVQVVTEDREYTFDEIVGYYVYRNNIFSLMIEEKQYV